jgi:cation transport ATPase
MNKCSYVLENQLITIMHVYGREKTMKKSYKIEVDCANCANKMEEAAKATAGVLDATVNFMALKMNVEFEEGADAKAVMKDVLKNCKKVEDDCEIYL